MNVTRNTKTPQASHSDTEMWTKPAYQIHDQTPPQTHTHPLSPPTFLSTLHIHYSNTTINYQEPEITTDTERSNYISKSPTLKCEHSSPTITIIHITNHNWQSLARKHHIIPSSEETPFSFDTAVCIPYQYIKNKRENQPMTMTEPLSLLPNKNDTYYYYYHTHTPIFK